MATMSSPPESEPSARATAPVLGVVKGDPTAEELAALVAVVASLGVPAAAPTRRTPEWNHHRRMQRVVLRPGPGAWRSSGLPR
jgi:acyl-CoA carboxylase epsilon subunit